MKFLITSLNGTVSIVGVFAFIAFMIFAVNGNAFWKPSLYVLIVSIVIGFLTSNSKEVDLYFNSKNEIEIK